MQKAKNWYLKAAEQGDASAQYNLGLMYDTGKGVAQDCQRREWYLKAAEQGHACAIQSWFMYDNGEGVAELCKRQEWYLKAAEQGDKFNFFTL